MLLIGIRRWLHRQSSTANDNVQSGVQTYNLYAAVSDNKDVNKGLNLLATCLVHVKSVS